MRITIAITNLDSGGGSQKVALQMAKAHTGYVQLLTCNYNGDNITVDNKECWHWLFPWRLIKQYYFYKNLKLDTDLVIAHDFPATALAFKNKTVWYCHTPLRFVWDMRGYYVVRYWMLSPLILVYSLLIRYLDKRAVKRIDTILCNSENVKERVKKYYGKPDTSGVTYRDLVTVMYPGVEPKKCKPRFKKYVLSVSRLVPEKHVDKIIRAMQHLDGFELHIVGDGPERKRLEGLVGYSHVRFLGNISEKELSKEYQNCYCVVYIPENEDLGLVPIEANSYGKMVIGIEEGGLKETIKDGVNGVFINSRSPYQIATIIKEIEPEKHIKQCLKNAEKFSLKRFNKEIDEKIHLTKEEDRWQY